MRYTPAQISDGIEAIVDAISGASLSDERQLLAARIIDKIGASLAGHIAREISDPVALLNAALATLEARSAIKAIKLHALLKIPGKRAQILEKIGQTRLAVEAEARKRAAA